MWADVIDEILTKLGEGKPLSKQEMSYLQRELDEQQELHVEKVPKKIFTGWTGNGIQRARVIIQKMKERENGHRKG